MARMTKPQRTSRNRCYHPIDGIGFLSIHYTDGTQSLHRNQRSQLPRGTSKSRCGLSRSCGRQSVKDPYVEEVREYRMEHTRRFDSDLHRICEDLREFEATLGARVVTLKPKRKKPKTTSRTKESP